MKETFQTSVEAVSVTMASRARMATQRFVTYGTPSRQRPQASCQLKPVLQVEFRIPVPGGGGGAECKAVNARSVQERIRRCTRKGFRALYLLLAKAKHQRTSQDWAWVIARMSGGPLIAIGIKAHRRDSFPAEQAGVGQSGHCSSARQGLVSWIMPARMSYTKACWRKLSRSTDKPHVHAIPDPPSQCVTSRSELTRLSLRLITH